ncbi:MAG: hypothetical protein AB8F65_00280 [Woeseiaceae bacterium]
MSTGRQLLSEIDQALTSSRQSFRKLDVELQSASAELARNRRQEASIYRRLATQRLVGLDDQTFVSELDQADKLARQLLSERDEQLVTIQADITAQDDLLSGIDSDRLRAEATLVTAEDQLEALLADVDATLQDDATYRALSAEAQQTIDVASAAETKTAEANEKREAKRGAFESDRLFMYLWERGYGTSEYRANLFSRMMDRICARHIRFERARQNYHLLNEIPDRLAKHTARLEERAAEAAVALADFERAADEAAGAKNLEAAVTGAEQVLAELDEKKVAAEQSFAALIEQREAFGSGDDPLFRQAMTVLGNQFRAEPIPQLRREAAMTPTRDDDDWVQTLGELREDQKRLQHYLDDHRGLHNRHSQRVSELSAIRSRFKQKQFDAFNSQIDRRGSISQMISEFMRGMISSERLWSSIRHAQRFKRTRQRHAQRRPSIGGVRIPRMPRGVRIPRNIGRSGGGFRTKGGF